MAKSQKSGIVGGPDTEQGKGGTDSYPSWSGDQADYPQAGTDIPSNRDPDVPVIAGLPEYGDYRDSSSPLSRRGSGQDSGGNEDYADGWFGEGDPWAASDSAVR
jgi:hypothetical protein